MTEPGHNVFDNAILCTPRPSSGIDCNQLVLHRYPLPSSYPTNHVLIKVDRFGFSTNNITYQVLGEHPHFRYFDFHPIPDAKSGSVSSKTHGLVPVWGFGTVVVSTHPKIQVGERVYGYFSLAKYLLLPITPTDVTEHAFYVSRPHLPSDRRPYNHVIRCANDPQYSSNPKVEDLTMLYRPLFWTAYWFEDWLFSSGYRDGASSILISSASSKTAFCLAYLVQKRIKKGEVGSNTKVIGLTSGKNLAFTNSLGLYNDVLTYDNYAASPLFYGKGTERWVYVDVASNGTLNKQLFAHFSSPYTGRLAACITLGLTNASPSGADVKWNENSSASLTTSTTSSPSSKGQGDMSQFWPQLEHFFMPEWLSIRRRQMSPKEIAVRQNEAWKELIQDGSDWVKLERYFGVEAIKRAYDRLVREGIGPEAGLIWSLWEQEPQIKSRL
ncbi:Protein of unknown function (DUF2855) domain containing protein [Amanita muscaria]